jgi:hypothetical protein
MIDGRRQSDPSLEGVGAVLLDEFHKRRVEVSQPPPLTAALTQYRLHTFIRWTRR